MFVLLDWCTSKTLSGEEWLTQHIKNWNNNAKQKLSFEETNHICFFGDGKKVSTIYSAKIPTIIGSYRIGLETDIVDSDITLLFSKSLIKEKTKF